MVRKFPKMIWTVRTATLTVQMTFRIFRMIVRRFQITNISESQSNGSKKLNSQRSKEVGRVQIMDWKVEKWFEGSGRQLGTIAWRVQITVRSFWVFERFKFSDFKVVKGIQTGLTHLIFGEQIGNFSWAQNVVNVFKESFVFDIIVCEDEGNSLAFEASNTV